MHLFQHCQELLILVNMKVTHSYLKHTLQTYSPDEPYKHNAKCLVESEQEGTDKARFLLVGAISKDKETGREQ
jgi:hypothetical protein